MIRDMKDEKQRDAIIRSLGVFELRGLAREVGVSSPTTKKREELISLISEKLKEGSFFDTQSQRRGRPYKKLNSLNEIVNNMVNENFKLEELSFDSVVRFMQEDNPIIFDVTEEVGDFEGFVRKQDKDLYLIDSATQEKVLINASVEFFDKLEVGAFIKIEAKKIDGSKFYYASKIYEINNISAGEFSGKCIEKGEEIINNDIIPYSLYEAKVGRRNIFCYSEDLYENDNFQGLMSYCEKNGYKLLLLSINTSYENQIMFRNVGIDNKFMTEYGSKPLISFNKIVDLINYTHYLVERGEKVVVFVPDILDVTRKIEELFIDKEPKNYGYSQQTILVVQKLLALGRAYQSGCSGTLIMGYNKANVEDQFLNADIFRISKKIN